MSLKIDKSAQPLLATLTPTMVQVVEMKRRSAGGYVSTGRRFLLAPDAPLFDAWGEVGTEARRTGAIALIAPLFDELLDIVQTSLA